MEKRYMSVRLNKIVGNFAHFLKFSNFEKSEMAVSQSYFYTAPLVRTLIPAQIYAHGKPLFFNQDRRNMTSL